VWPNERQYFDCNGNRANLVAPPPLWPRGVGFDIDSGRMFVDAMTFVGVTVASANQKAYNYGVGVFDDLISRGNITCSDCILEVEGEINESSAIDTYWTPNVYTNYRTITVPANTTWSTAVSSDEWVDFNLRNSTGLILSGQFMGRVSIPNWTDEEQTCTLAVGFLDGNTFGPYTIHDSNCTAGASCNSELTDVVWNEVYNNFINWTITPPTLSWASVHVPVGGGSDWTSGGSGIYETNFLCQPLYEGQRYRISYETTTYTSVMGGVTVYNGIDRIQIWRGSELVHDFSDYGDGTIGAGMATGHRDIDVPFGGAGLKVRVQPAYGINPPLNFEFSGSITITKL
jgi:hypothetical protein